MINCIVTGATGFIGSRMCRHLLNLGYSVTIITRKSSNYTNINQIIDKIKIFEYSNDINSLIDLFKNNSFDIVIHLASLFISENTSEDVDLLIDTNIKFSTHILEAMRYSSCKKIINTSTYWQHYNNDYYNPSCLYAATKQAFEDIIKFYTESFDIDCITLELFDTYGENDTRNKILNLLSYYSNNNILLDMSKGEQIIDLLYVDDVIDAYLIAINRLVNNIDTNHIKYSLKSQNRVTLKKLIEIYINITGNNVNINWGGRPYRKREIMIPWDKGNILPNWKPKYSIEEGIKKSFVKGELEDKNE